MKKKKYLGLVVDDHPGNRQEVTDYLRAMGHLWEETGNLEDARKLLMKQRFDFAVLDLQIHQGPKSVAPKLEFGYALLDEVIDRYPGMGILVVSGVAKKPEQIQDVLVRMGRCPALRYVAKPFDGDGNGNFRSNLEIVLALREHQREGGNGVPKPPQQGRATKGPIESRIPLIDLSECYEAAHHSFVIRIDGEEVKVPLKLLLILVVCGERQERHGPRDKAQDVMVEATEFGIGNGGGDTEFTSAFSRARKRLKEIGIPHPLRRVRAGSFVLGARVENASKARTLLSGTAGKK